MGFKGRIDDMKKYLLFVSFSVICFTILGDILLLHELKRSYAETENIISGIANGADSGDALLKYLKEVPNETWLKDAENHLLLYGYDSSAVTVWDKKYQSSKRRVLIVSAIFDLLLLLSFFVLSMQDKRRIAELEKALRQIQDTDSDVPDLSFTDLDEVLKDRILSLQEQIQTDHLQIQREKEETKSLVTDISHQLKTPVASLKTSLELLSTEELTPKERKEFFDNCLYQLDGLSNLTKTLINVSRMEKGMIQILAEPVEIRETIYSAVNRVYEKASEKHISIEMSEGSYSGDILVMHDRKWTTEVLVNILDNAIKYSGEYSQITINLVPLTFYVRIDIADEGIGIPKSEYHKVFQRFYRGTSVKQMEGSGVGLYLAREIVEQQNGSIFVRSKNGAKTGSIFCVQLPKVR